jgi:DNA adenine methylase
MFIPYLGEKSKFSNFIIPNIPNNISTYVEPFGGMMGIFFSLNLSNFNNVKFIYNDSNWLNYNLFKQLQNSDFISEVEYLIPSEEDYIKAKNGLSNNSWNEKESAINWLIILCCSDSKYEISSSSYKGNNELEIFQMKLKFGKDRISKLSNIHNLEYGDIIQRYDSESTFFYLDPPYKNREHYYINHNFTSESHCELSQILKNIKGRFALSYYYFPEIDDWYKECNIIKNKTLMGTEFLIMNY